MEDKSQEVVLPGSMKKLNSRRKRRINMERWRDIKRKKLKDAGEIHKSGRESRLDIYPSRQASRIMF
jgi:hypothetical protein